MSVHPIRGESKTLATLGADARVSVVECLAAKRQGTMIARIATFLALRDGMTVELSREEWKAAGKPLRFTLTEPEAIAWGLALAALHMLPNRERIWI